MSANRQGGVRTGGTSHSSREMTGGNKTKAAELLEISHRALLYKIKGYGL